MSLFVSVIIPVYNDPVGIDKCLKALVEQTWPRDAYEIIVADNRSTDETQCIIQNYAKKYPDLVRIVVEKEIQSSYAARNKALRAARGEILAFTDSDCVPTQNWIEAGVKALQRHRATCGGGHIEFFFKAEQPNIYEYFDSIRKLNQKSYIENAGFAATANFFVCRKLFSRYGGFRHELISGGDYEFGRRLTQNGEKLIYIFEAVVRHPARATFSEIWKKSKRVAIGQKDLKKLGLLEHGQITWKTFIPTIRYLKKNQFSPLQRIQLLIFANILKYSNLIRRLG